MRMHKIMIVLFAALMLLPCLQAAAETPAEPRYESARLMQSALKKSYGLEAVYVPRGDDDLLLYVVTVSASGQFPKINVMGIFSPDTSIVRFFVYSQYVTFEEKDLETMYQLVNRANGLTAGVVRFVADPEKCMIIVQSNPFVIDEDSAVTAFASIFYAASHYYSLFAEYDVTER